MSAAFHRPVLLDVTRLVSRTGAGPLTGIDRVERALLAGLLAREIELHGLCRTASGFSLLPRDGLAALLRRIEGTERWGEADVIGRISLRLTPERRAAESDIRRLASGHARGSGLGALLSRHVPPGTLYLNAGHTNLKAPVFDAVRAVKSARAAVMIHDVIPLRMPWTQRAGAAARFAEKIGVVARHADLVMCPSAAEAEQVAAALRNAGREPSIAVAPPGIDLVRPDPMMALPEEPYLVAVGTIEPRKNVSLLLDVWEHLAATRDASAVPGLVLIGRRGWEDARVLRRLDDVKARLPQVREHADLQDSARASLVAGARALLFPSVAEGYGLPPLEALSLGVVPVCAPLPVYRETMGEAAVYARSGDLYHWAEVVGGLVSSTRTPAAARDWRPPSWDDFVNRVLATCA
jgi:glycosyltransferase involved in cell wall biosynthesis